MEIDSIRRLVKKNKYHYSSHAKDMLLSRGLEEEKIAGVILAGEVIESYKDDLRGKSYLLLGDGPLHVLVGYNKYQNKAIIITAYIPEFPKWINSRKRG